MNGLHVLLEEIRKRNIRLHHDQKGQIIPIYSFLNQLITSLKAFARSDEYQFWFQYFLAHNVNQRMLSNFIKSWQKLAQNSLECQLLMRLLIVSSKNKIKMYLKARRLIINTTKTNRQMIDEVLLNLQDTIAIIFKLFDSESIRKAIVSGVKNIFLSFKIVEAKIYSPVLIEYLLSVFDSIFHIQNSEATILEHFQTYKSSSKNQSKFDSISNFQSQMHQENGLYRKNIQNNLIHKKYHIIDRKFIPMKDNYGLKFNEQFSSMTKQDQIQQKEKSSFYNFVSQTKTLKEKSLSKSNTSEAKIKFINTIYKEEEEIKKSMSPNNSSKLLLKNSSLTKKLSFVQKNNSYSSQKKKQNRKRSNTEIEDIFFRKDNKNNSSSQIQNYNKDKRDIVTTEKYQKMITKNKQFKQKMLKTSHFRPLLVNQQQNQGYDSIQNVHDSIVRNSRYWKQKLQPAPYVQ